MLRRRSRLAIVATVVTLALSTLALPVAGTFPGGNGPIAYYDASGDIWVMNPDGTGQVNLTNTPDAAEVWPAFSPDGQQIAYRRYEAPDYFPMDIWVMNAAGTDQRNLTNGAYGEAGYPFWSPDGSRIGFITVRVDTDGNEIWQLRVMQADGTAPELLYEQLGAITADWSPDGTRIALFSGVDLRLLAPDGTSTVVPVPGLLWGSSPSWAPDGLKLVFVGAASTGNGLLTVNPDGSGLARIAAFESVIYRTSWSPDGSWIVYDDINGGIYTVRPDGTDLVQIAARGLDGPSWGALPATGYDFTGFFAPVDNAALNVAKAGSAIPVKFSLGGDQGLDIFADGYTKAVPIACDTGEPFDTIETYVVASNSGLKYSADADQYTYVWKTQKGWTGCLQLQVKLDDGTTHTADFKFR
jgi:Tol biopolymer transport system component